MPQLEALADCSIPRTCVLWHLHVRETAVWVPCQGCAQRRTLCGKADSHCGDAICVSAIW